MAIWGWAPVYFVQSGLRCATRDVIGFYVLNPQAHYDHYRKTYLQDIQQAKPRFFVDAVGTGFYCPTWPHPVEKARYTMDAALAAYIDAHYHLHSEIIPARGAPAVRIYVRND